MLNPAAEEPAADLAALLVDRGVAVRVVAVYRTIAAGLAAPPAGIDAVLIHSAKAARLVAGLVTLQAANGLALFAISDAAARPLRGLPFAAVAIAEFPDEAHLLGLLHS